MSNKYGLKYIDPITGNFNRVEYMKEYNKEYRLNNKEKEKEYRLKNKERLKEYGKEYRLKNKERLKEQRKEYLKEYLLKNKEQRKEYNREYYLKNKERLTEYRKEYHLKNKEKKNLFNREYRLKNKERLKEYGKEYRLNNKEKGKEYRLKNKEKRNEHCRNRRKTDIGFRILSNLRTRIWYAVKGEDKSNTTMKLLGCSISDFKKHIESLFKPWMAWENYGRWTLDHIIPCAAFDLTLPEQQQKCFHYSNLQPLDAIENSKKGSMYDNKRYRKTYEKK